MKLSIKVGELSFSEKDSINFNVQNVHVDGEVNEISELTQAYGKIFAKPENVKAYSDMAQTWADTMLRFANAQEIKVNVETKTEEKA